MTKTLQFSYKNVQLKISSAKWRPFCLGFNVLQIIARETTLSNYAIIMFVNDLDLSWRRQMTIQNDTVR